MARWQDRAGEAGQDERCVLAVGFDSDVNPRDCTDEQLAQLYELLQATRNADGAIPPGNDGSDPSTDKP